MNQITRQCKQILIDEGIDANSSIDFDVNGEVHTMTFEYIIDTFMQASEESQLVFYAALQKALDAKIWGLTNSLKGWVNFCL